MLHGARILVAPLDWGLGHAARCVPIVQALQAHGAVPILGADGGPLALLRREFPELEHVRIPGMEVRYGRGSSQLWSMARQFPAMVRSIRAEQAVFERLRHDLRLDAVISDQRFGLRSEALPSVLVTHQVFPFTPIAQGAMRKVNAWHIGRFDRCWVMDEAQPPGLAGELSHGPRLPSNARYIGAQSRFAEMEGNESAPHHRILAVISGPEPQRSMLESLLLEQLPRIDGDHLLVRGLPASPGERQEGRVRIVDHLPGEALSAAMRNAALIVSRSGYTTLMDLAAIGRSALIIPTPGQPEQEYLGDLHARSGRFLVQHQRSIDLNAAMQWRQPAAAAQPDAPLLAHALKDLATLLGR
jgi:predicted glycosyltransferase